MRFSPVIGNLRAKWVHDKVHVEALDGSGYRAVQQRHASVMTPAADMAKFLFPLCSRSLRNIAINDAGGVGSPQLPAG